MAKRRPSSLRSQQRMDEGRRKKCGKYQEMPPPPPLPDAERIGALVARFEASTQKRGRLSLAIPT